jgi:nitrate/nitrite transport system permease protein
MNLSTLAVASQAAWKRAKPVVVRDTVLLPLAGFAGLIAVW